MKHLLLFLLCFLLLIGCQSAQTPADGVTVALLDTGVSTAAIAAEELLAGHNYVTDFADTEDRLNHGTAVASILLGCSSAGVARNAPNACRVVPLVVADTAGSVPPQTLAQAIRDAAKQYHADIIHVSLGIQTDDPDVRSAIAYAEEQGVLVVAAVGNDGNSQALFYPAAYDTVLAVGSHDKDLAVSRFSQQNGTADLLAPGEDIWMASIEGETYGSQGTSYAAAYVTAAAAALLEQDPALSPAMVRQALFDAARDIGAPGYDVASGWGILQFPQSS